MSDAQQVNAPPASNEAPPAPAAAAAAAAEPTAEEIQLAELKKEKEELTAQLTAKKQLVEKETDALEKIIAASKEAAQKREDMLRMVAVTQKQRADAVDSELEAFTGEVTAITTSEENVTNDLEEKQFQVSLAKAKTDLEQRTVAMETARERMEYFQAKTDISEKTSKVLHTNAKSLKTTFAETRKALEASDAVHTNKNKAASDRHAAIEDKVQELETEAKEQLASIEEMIKNKSSTIEKHTALAKEAFELQSKLNEERSCLVKEEQAYVSQRKELWGSQQQLLLQVRAMPEEDALKEKLMLSNTQKITIQSEIEHSKMLLRALQCDIAANKDARDTDELNAIFERHEDIVNNADKTVGFRTSARNERLALQKLKHEIDDKLVELETEISEKTLRVEGIRAKRLLETEGGETKRSKNDS